MSNCLSIGFVYSKMSKEKELNNVLEWISNKSWELSSLKYSEDSDGDKWLELKDNITVSDVSNAFLNKFLGICSYSKSFEANKTVDFTLVYKELTKNDFGFLIQIEASQVYEFGNIESLKRIEMDIISLAECLYKVSKYSYAFADDEVDIEFTIEQINDDIDTRYSILIIPKNDKEVKIEMSSWALDGLTSRV